MSNSIRLHQKLDDFLKLYSAFKNVGPARNLVMFEVFGVNFAAKKSIFSPKKPSLKNRFFGRKFHSKNLKNDQNDKFSTHCSNFPLRQINVVNPRTQVLLQTVLCLPPEIFTQHFPLRSFHRSIIFVVHR